MGLQRRPGRTVFRAVQPLPQLGRRYARRRHDHRRGRNVDPSAGAIWGFVEIVVADDGEGMPEEVLSQALTPYFTTKAAGSGIGLGLVQVQRFAEGRGGTIGIESEQGAGTLVRLFLPRVCGAAVPGAAAETEIAYAPSPDGDGGVFHIVNAAATAPTS